LISIGAKVSWTALIKFVMYTSRPSRTKFFFISSQIFYTFTIQSIPFIFKKKQKTNELNGLNFVINDRMVHFSSLQSITCNY